MKSILRLTAFLLLTSFLLASCSKELSKEISGTGVIIGSGTAEGSFTGAPDACSNAVTGGAYGVNLPTGTGDTVVLSMNFTNAGTYSISTDTINGLYFSGSGNIAAPGTTSVVLNAHGTPAVTGTYDFTVTFKTSVCGFPVNVSDVAVSNGTDYFPVTTNSFWKFVSSDPAALPADTLRNTSTGDIFSDNGVNYNLFVSSNSNGEDSLFFNKANGEYHQLGDMDIAGAANNVVAADYIFLKDNVAVGTTWESPEGDADISGVNAKLKLKMTLSAKDVNVQVENLVFKDVIKVITAEQVQLPAGWSTILTYETWYAKGIGIINITAPSPLYGYEVQSYQVF